MPKQNPDLAATFKFQDDGTCLCRLGRVRHCGSEAADGGPVGYAVMTEWAEGVGASAVDAMIAAAEALQEQAETQRDDETPPRSMMN